MFFDLIRNRQTVRIYYGLEEGFIVTTITRYYPKFDMIRVAHRNMLIPLDAVAKIEIADEADSDGRSPLPAGRLRP